VLGGTITGTVLGVVFVPLFFVVVQKLFGRTRLRAQAVAKEA